MTTFRTSIFLAGLLLWTGTTFAQEESLDELLEGFEESPSSRRRIFDDLLDGFEEPEAFTNELLDGFEEPTETPDASEGLLEGFEENLNLDRNRQPLFANRAGRVNGNQHFLRLCSVST